MDGVASARRRNLQGHDQFRIIASRFPPIPLFEELVDADELEIVFALESMTNDRLAAEAGDLYRVDKDDWVTGPGASVVMAAFTHIAHPSRFTDGSYGVYYAGLDEPTAIAETRFHAERRLRETEEPPIELEMRCYRGKIKKPLEDIRGPSYSNLSDPSISTWPRCQQHAAERRAANAMGLLYRSARRPEGQCIAAFSPQAVSRPTPKTHLRYCWNGERIDEVLSVVSLVP